MHVWQPLSYNNVPINTDNVPVVLFETYHPFPKHVDSKPHEKWPHDPVHVNGYSNYSAL